MFETRSQAWREVGLVHQVSPGAVRRARLEALLLVPLFVGIVLLYNNRAQLGLEHSSSEVKGLVQAATAVLLLIIGWAIARDAGRAIGPALFRRLDPATAGIVGFLIRLVTIAIALLIALVIAGVETRTLAVGGAFTAVILGLAAQQTLGNLIAGTVLLSAGPFRVGDRVRLQGGPLAGQIEGIASSLGLLYTTFATDEGSILVPNSVVLNVAVYTGAGTLRTYKSVVEESAARADGSAEHAEEAARPAPPPPPAHSTRGSPARRAR
jgi:small conductance mechanosensitive channel